MLAQAVPEMRAEVSPAAGPSLIYCEPLRRCRCTSSPRPISNSADRARTGRSLAHVDTPAISDRQLPPLRQDLKLLPGPVQSDGSPTWRIQDAIRNRFFQIGWLEFELLSRWDEVADGRTLIARVAAQTTLEPQPAELAELLEFLGRNQLLLGIDRRAQQGLKRRWLAGVRPWQETLLHHYLFFRIPLVRPSGFLDATLPLARALVHPFMLAVLAAVALADLLLVTRQWETFSQTFQYFFTLEGLLGYALAIGVSKTLHELAHAWTARHYGVRVPTMGVAFLVLWPMLYTDTSESWKLTNPRHRFRVAAAGITAELALAILAALCWGLAPDGPVRSVFFLLATTTWVLTLAINASPFMRFDGYYLLSDALDMPNLHERSGALARHWIRSRVFGIEHAPPEPDWSPGQRAGLILFALATWAYRLVLFLGIALLVYHLFFKLLGIALMAVEIGWFIARPIWTEMRWLWRHRLDMRWRPHAIGLTLITLALLAWLVPVASDVSAPALMRAREEQNLFAPVPARVAQVAVRNGALVRKGDRLVLLESPDLQSRIERTEMRIRSHQAELRLRGTSEQRLERTRVVMEQLAESLADLEAARSEAAQLDLIAHSDGRVRDLPTDLVQDRWVNPKQLLLRVTSDRGALLEAYVGEQQVGALAPGQAVSFYPAAAGRPVVRGHISSIDTAVMAIVPRPLLASTHGGEIAVSAEPGRSLRAHDPLYRITIEADPGTPDADRVLRGRVRIDIGLQAVASNLFSRTAALILRESGF